MKEKFEKAINTLKAILDEIEYFNESCEPFLDEDRTAEDLKEVIKLIELLANPGLWGDPNNPIDGTLRPNYQNNSWDAYLKGKWVGINNDEQILPEVPVGDNTPAPPIPEGSLRPNADTNKWELYQDGKWIDTGVLIDIRLENDVEEL